MTNRQHPRVSVVMAARNTERWIGAAIDSVLAQTLTDLELLIVDDGSTDDTPAIIAERAARDRRIRVFSPGRVGVVEARNMAIREALGEYIAIMDSDDLSTPDRFAKQVAFLDADPDAVAVTTSMAYIRHQQAVPASLTDLKIKHSPGPPAARLEGFNLEYRPIFHGPAMLRRDALIRAGLYRPSFFGAEDADLMLRLEELGPIGRLSEPLYLRRKHLENLGFRAPYAQIEAAVLAVLAARRRRRGKPDLPGESGRPFWRLFRFGLTPAEIGHAVVVAFARYVRAGLRRRKSRRRRATAYVAPGDHQPMLMS